MKLLTKEIAFHLNNKQQIALHKEPSIINLASKPCTQADVESIWAAYWFNKLGIPAEHIYHRKSWELAYVSQALYEKKAIIPENCGIVFGCGKEILPSFFASLGCTIKATDALPTDSILNTWAKTNQYSSKKDDLYYDDFLSYELFDQRVTFEHADMNNIPSEYDGKFDFCWSICAFEHLGSIENGLAFVENSLKTLKPGGVAVHTAEINLYSDTKTITNGDTVLFRKSDYQTLFEHLTSHGYMVQEADFATGNSLLDLYIDLPPYNINSPHLKLLHKSFVTTSFGIIIKKK